MQLRPPCLRKCICKWVEGKLFTWKGGRDISSLVRDLEKLKGIKQSDITTNKILINEQLDELNYTF